MSEETVTGDARAEALDVDAIEARYEATTPGAWDYITQGIVGLRSQSSEDAVSHPLFQAYKSEEDGVFVAHAHQDVPALIGEVERLTAQLQAAEQRLADERASR